MKLFLRRFIIASLCLAAHAQQTTEPPSLDQILDRLQSNLNDYRATIPNFFADERVTSQVRRYDSSDSKTVTDATFRLKRREPPVVDPRLNLNETRELRTVNHVPVRNDSLIMPGPVIVEGVFSNGAGIVSREMEHCFDYTLHSSANYGSQPAIAIDFRFKSGSEKDRSCSGPRNSSGTAIFDAAGLHPLRVEMSVPDYEVYPGTSDLALWRWRVDYLPVTFDNRQFWLPTRIKSRIDANDKLTTWYFDAEYTHYHKLEVASHIVPSDPQDAH